MKNSIFYILLTTVCFSCKNNYSNIEDNQLESFKKTQDSLLNELKIKDKYIFLPDEYGVDIIQLGGYGSKNIQVDAFSFEEIAHYDSKEFVNYHFTNTGNLWVTAIPGYEITSAYKVNANKLKIESGKSVCLEPLNAQRNDFGLIMKKLSYFKYLDEIKAKKYTEMSN